MMLLLIHWFFYFQIRSQSFDQTAASKSPPPSPLTPAFVHFSPGRDSRKEVVGGQDIHRHSYEHQKVAAWPDESAATQSSTNLAVGSSAIGTGSAGRDSTRLSRYKRLYSILYDVRYAIFSRRC